MIPYRLLSGTSMAAPHVAGVVALLLSAQPSLRGQTDLIKTIVAHTADPMYYATCGAGPGGLPNNGYGWGIVNAQRAIESLGQAGTLRGTVTDTRTGLALAAATVTLYALDGGTSPCDGRDRQPGTLQRGGRLGQLSGGGRAVGLSACRRFAGLCGGRSDDDARHGVGATTEALSPDVLWLTHRGGGVRSFFALLGRSLRSTPWQSARSKAPLGSRQFSSLCSSLACTTPWEGGFLASIPVFEYNRGCGHSGAHRSSNAPHYTSRGPGCRSPTPGERC